MVSMRPIFECRIANEEANVVSHRCVVLLATGQYDCDLLMSAHDAMNLRLSPSMEVKATKLSSLSETDVQVVRMHPSVRVSFMLERRSGTTHEAAHSLEVWVDQAELETEMKNRDASVVASSSSSCAASNSVHSIPVEAASGPAMTVVPPITYSSGMSEGKAILGLTGMAKLHLCFNPARNEIFIRK